MDPNDGITWINSAADLTVAFTLLDGADDWLVRLDRQRTSGLGSDLLDCKGLGSNTCRAPPYSVTSSPRQSVSTNNSMLGVGMVLTF